jgi:excisionase family DNA binding protein
MSSQAAQLSLSQPAQTLDEELPVTVKVAANFLGVSTQTVYLWVERKRIPHLRVMGRNVRFLRFDLATFRVQFTPNVENGTEW